MELNKELAELVGAFIGDGHKSKWKNTYCIEFVGHPILDKEYIEYLSRIIKASFKVNPKIKIREKGVRMTIKYKELYFFFNNLGFKDGSKSANVVIPDVLYNSNLINHVIRGLFDTDGFVFVDKRKIYKLPYVRIGYSTKSRALHEQLIDFFVKRGYKLYTRVDKRDNSYELEIYGKKQLSRWFKEFGFSNENKKNYKMAAEIVGLTASVA